MRNNHQMKAFLSNALGSSENIGNRHDGLNYGRLPDFSTSSLRSEIPERLLQDDASTLSPSYSEQNLSATHKSLQENACSPQEQSLQQKDATQRVAFRRHEDTQDQPEDVSESSTALFQEQNHSETGQDVRKPSRKPYSWKEKLGTFAIVGLIAGSVLLCAAIGTLAFMWFGSPAIPAWKEITARNWLSKAISICIGVIQQVMMLQLGIVTATLASLALESKDVMIGDVASVSVMRATAASTGAFVMVWQYISGGSYRNTRHSSNIFLILSAALLWCLSQFLLLIILTDVSLRSTAGLASAASLPFSLRYNVTDDGMVYSQFEFSSVGAWRRKISKYASFAEYSEPPYEADGVSDTGVTLRAFLPFSTAQSRENLESYKGNSTVLDARVTCQVPQIKNATFDTDGRFGGSIAATRNTPRLATVSLGKGSTGRGMGVRFDCVLSLINRDPTSPEWPLTLCQLWQTGITLDSMRSFGGLYSEFQNPSLMGGTDHQGSVYLFLNVTLGIDDDFWSTVSLPGLAVAEASQERGEWLDLIYSNGSAIISASICYAAFDFAEVDVSISSQSNRTESRLEPVFDQGTSSYTFQGLRYAMGQDRSLPVDRRGMLKLEKGTWPKAPDIRYPDSQYFWALYLRTTTDLDRDSRPYIGDSWPPYLTTLLGKYSTCASLQDNPCVAPELMHVSKLLDDIILPQKVAVALVDSKWLVGMQIVRYDLAGPGRTRLAIPYSRHIDL